jgi:hypothetical protein
MVDIEASERPTVAQALEHPFFWPVERRHEFLCACGNLEQVKSGSRDAQALLPPSLLPGGAPWTAALDPALWEQARARTKYNTRSVPDLLRFLRNLQQHGADRDMKAGMAAALTEPGGPAAHFERLFPWLLVPVWRAAPSLDSGQQLSSFPVRCLASRGGSGGTGEGETAGGAAAAGPGAGPGAGAGSRSDDGGGADGSGTGGARSASVAATQEPARAVPIATWLTSVNPALAVYAEAMADYGFENTGMLGDAEEEELAECFAELGVKKPHQAKIRRAIAALGGVR